MSCVDVENFFRAWIEISSILKRNIVCENNDMALVEMIGACLHI